MATMKHKISDALGMNLTREAAEARYDLGQIEIIMRRNSKTPIEQLSTSKFAEYAQDASDIYCDLVFDDPMQQYEEVW